MTLEPQQQQPQRLRVAACSHHPAEPITGICAACLRERLAGFDPAASARHTPGAGGGGGGGTAVAEASLPPGLRRCKSLSVGECESSLEPRRRSCDVRVRSRHTLSYLFNLDDERSGTNGEVRVGTENIGFFPGVAGTVFESGEEHESVEEIRGCDANASTNEIAEAVEKMGEEGETKTMKEHIDLELQTMNPYYSVRDLKNIAGSFRVVASEFSKKLCKWKRRQKIKKRHKSGDSAITQVGKPRGRPSRDTQSEAGDCRFGRRSCYTEPRFSVDAARLSLDDRRYSFDERRASWDGHLIGRSARGLDNHVLVKGQMNSNMEMPVVEAGYVESLSIARASPGMIHETKFLNVGAYVGNSSSNSAQDDCSESTCKDKDSSSSVANDGGNEKELRNCDGRRKPWNIWGLARRQRKGKHRDGDLYCTGNEVDDSRVESSGNFEEEYSRQGGACNGMLMRSKSCVCRPCNTVSSFHGRNDSVGAQSHGVTGKKRRDSVLDRNQVSRHSPSSHEGGLLRFYLTPLRIYRSVSHNGRLNGSRSIARSTLRQ